jgi:ankyrin repeat protein
MELQMKSIFTLMDLKKATDTEIIEYARSKGVDSCDEFGAPLLLLCLRNGYFAVARQLIQLGARMDLSDYTKENPLHVAARQKQADLIGLLVEHGADINGQDDHGNTPLHVCFTAGGDVDATFEELLRHGADPTMKSKFGPSIIETVTKQDVKWAQAILDMIPRK